jgi:hypothetical protein
MPFWRHPISFLIRGPCYGFTVSVRAGFGSNDYARGQAGSYSYTASQELGFCEGQSRKQLIVSGLILPSQFHHDSEGGGVGVCFFESIST